MKVSTEKGYCYEEVSINSIDISKARKTPTYIEVTQNSHLLSQISSLKGIEILIIFNKDITQKLHTINQSLIDEKNAQ